MFFHFTCNWSILRFLISLFNTKNMAVNKEKETGDGDTCCTGMMVEESIILSIYIRV